MEIVTEIVQYKITDLILSEYNPRKISVLQQQELTTSIKKFGFVDPIVINKHKSRMNVVIGGFQRIKIAKKLRIKVVPCVELKLTIKDEKELNIRLNKNQGSFDRVLLDSNFKRDDLISYGFTEDDLLAEEQPPLKPKIETITPIKQIHILISMNPDDYENVKDDLKKLQTIPDVEYEQSYN